MSKRKTKFKITRKINFMKFLNYEYVLKNTFTLQVLSKYNHNYN